MRNGYSVRSGPSRRIRIAMIVAAFALVSGCAQQGRWTRADYELGYAPPAQDPLSDSELQQDSKLTDLSARIYLIADNQRHELLGDGVAWFRTATSDAKIASAIRPPQLDLFGQDLLGEALAMSDGFVLHLGDACDISNTGEFGLFAWDMQRAKRGWVMAPGNHDGFFFGNSSRTVEGLIQEWNDSAETFEFDGARITSHAMQKDRFVSYYLAALILQDDIWSAPLASALGPKTGKIFAEWTGIDPSLNVPKMDRTFPEFWSAMVELQEEIYRVSISTGNKKPHVFELPEELDHSGQPHLRRIAWHIDSKKVWRSFILQEVDISAPSTPAATVSNPTPISILVFDTAQYGVQPSLDNGLMSKFFSKLTLNYLDVQVAGLHGNILDSQEGAADAFVATMREENRNWILASHHPYDELGRDTIERFDKVRDAGGIPATLSGHTHTGGIRWNNDDKREGDWLEINVGSILDSPVEFRDFQVHRLGDRVAINSNRRLMEDMLRERGLMADDLPGYRPEREDADFYMNYQEGSFLSEQETDFIVKKILLAAYLRMFNLFEADHPNQGSTYWPTGPDGNPLTSHNDVIEAVQNMLSETKISAVRELTAFLYELREFDRTRRYSDSTREQVRAYRLSQAIWASSTELPTRSGAKETLDPNISFFALPRPIAETSH